MVSLQCEPHVWSLKPSLFVKDTDFGTFRYYDKFEIPPDRLYGEDKKSFCEKRGFLWTPTNKRPDRLRDSLKELEELLSTYEVLFIKWRCNKFLQLILSCGVFIGIKVSNSGEIEKISIDKYLFNKHVGDDVARVAFSNRYLIMSHLDQKINVYYFNKEVSFDAFDKLSSYDIKSHIHELPSLSTKRTEKNVVIREDNELVMFWSVAIETAEVHPWSPSIREEQHANVLVYKLNKQHLQLITCMSTTFCPLHVSFDPSRADSVVLLLSRINENGTNFVDYCHAEVGRRPSAKQTVLTVIPLESPVACVSFSDDLFKLAIGCEDGSITMYDSNLGVVYQTSCFFRPIKMSWHFQHSLLIASSKHGQLQCFDLALNCLSLHSILEDYSPNKVLDTSVYFANFTPTVHSVIWASLASNEFNRTNGVVEEMIFVYFGRGPFVVIRVNAGCVGRGLGPMQLASQYVKHRQIHETVSILSSISWDHRGDKCLSILSLVVNHLLRQPLNSKRETWIENSLGTFHTPVKPHLQSTLDAYADQVRDLTRKFFHCLLRHKQLEKAFRLAVDLNDHDLFVDIFNYSKALPDTELSKAAWIKAREIRQKDLLVDDQIGKTEPVTVDDMKGVSNFSHSSFLDYYQANDAGMSVSKAANISTNEFHSKKYKNNYLNSNGDSRDVSPSFSPLIPVMENSMSHLSPIAALHNPTTFSISSLATPVPHISDIALSSDRLIDDINLDQKPLKNYLDLIVQSVQSPNLDRSCDKSNLQMKSKELLLAQSFSNISSNDQNVKTKFEHKPESNNIYLPMQYSKESAKPTEFASKNSLILSNITYSSTSNDILHQEKFNIRRAQTLSNLQSNINSLSEVDDQNCNKPHSLPFISKSAAVPSTESQLSPKPSERDLSTYLPPLLTPVRSDVCGISSFDPAPNYEVPSSTELQVAPSNFILSTFPLPSNTSTLGQSELTEEVSSNVPPPLPTSLPPSISRMVPSEHVHLNLPYVSKTDVQSTELPPLFLSETPTDKIENKLDSIHLQEEYSNYLPQYIEQFTDNSQSTLNSDKSIKVIHFGVV